MPAIAMAHDEDPTEVLLKQVGDLSQVEVFNNQVLVAIYMRPEKSKSGIYVGPGAQKEDEYQGKAMLILKTGPSAFQSDDKWFTHGGPKVGDWIIARPGDTWQLSINKARCRMMNDTAVRMKIPSPDICW
jgi:co-chaperonin GroES (HSP10)